MLRCLCDMGSQINLITGDIAQMLKLKKQPTAIEINGLTGTKASNSLVNISIKSNDNKVEENLNAYVLKKIINKMPTKRLNIEEWPHIKSLKLADREFFIPNEIDMLVGAEFYSKIIKNGIVKRDGAPTAQKTTFGWIVFGVDGESHQNVV